MNFTPENASRKDIYDIGANDDEWHFIVINVDRNDKMCAYVDDVLVNSTDISNVKGSIDAGSFVIGADGLKKYGVEDVYLDEVRVFNRILEEDERSSYFYEVNLAMRLQNLERLLEDAKQDESVSANKIEELENAIESFKSEMDELSNEEMLDMAKRMDIVKERFFEDEDTSDISFQVLSDVHIEGKSENLETVRIFKDALQDIRYLDPDSSAIMIPGDFTNGGSEEQYESFFNLIDEYASTDPIVALGNHDVRWLCDSEDRNEAGLRIPTCKVGTSSFADRYLKGNKKYMGDVEEGQLYFDKWIDGYHFITLNTEQDLKDQAYLSEEQLDWLEEVIAEDASASKPIFLQIHQTFEGTAEHEELDLIGGESEIRLKEILRKYPQAIIFTGHIHNGIDLLDVYHTDYGFVVDVPCFWYSSYGDDKNQVGYQVDVDGENIRIRLRDYENNTYLDEYEFNFNISVLFRLIHQTILKILFLTMK